MKWSKNGWENKTALSGWPVKITTLKSLDMGIAQTEKAPKKTRRRLNKISQFCGLYGNTVYGHFSHIYRYKFCIQICERCYVWVAFIHQSSMSRISKVINLCKKKCVFLHKYKCVYIYISWWWQPMCPAGKFKIGKMTVLLNADTYMHVYIMEILMLHRQI